MNNKILILVFVCLVVIIFSCGKDNPLYQAQPKQGTLASEPASVSSPTVGGKPWSGIAYFDTEDACDVQSQGATYSLNMTGTLSGCYYTWVDEFECSPSGTYREIGREYFVGTYNGKFGTFRTNYKFEAKYEGCAANGSYVGAEIKGRCQHPIAVGSGTGVFEGVNGRLDFRDDIEAGNYPYSVRLQF